MALVQKRHHSEPTKTIQAEDAPRKKIRITTKRPSRSVTVQIKKLEASLSSNETLQILTELSDCSSFDETSPETIRFLSSLFRKDKDFVRVKILYLFLDLASDQAVDVCFLIEEILTLLKSEESSKVICQGLTSLLRIGQSSQEKIPQVVLNKVVEFAKSKLTSTSHNVQRHAIQLIGAFASKEDAEKDLMALISNYMDSSDARTRAQAMNSILCMGKRSIELTPSLYARAEKALKDDYECGRKEALQLIYEMSQRHPEL